MKIGIVIVTYWSRKELLKNTIYSALKNNPYKIIIVDNNCDYDVEWFLKKTFIAEKEKITIIKNKENKWSAWWIYDGLKHIQDNEKNIEYILLLDDDNIITDQNWLKIFFETYEQIKKEKSINNNKLCLMGHREYISRNLYKYINEKYILYPKNDFLSFDIFYKIKNIFFKEKKIDKKKIYKIPYGFRWGLFFHKDIIQTNGLPNQKYYLYCDDVDFTLRFTLWWGQIYYIPGIRIKDLEYSFWDNKTPNPLFDKSTLKIYYTIKNRAYIDKHILKKTSFKYKINKRIIFLGIGILWILTLKFKRVKLIFSAIDDGAKWNIWPKNGFYLK